MNVYNADIKKSNDKNLILKHIGTSPFLAAERIEGMFAHQRTCSFNADLTVNIHDKFMNIISTIPFDEHIDNFCKHAKKYHITEYKMDVSKPLRLLDIWQDDPIGSAGPNLIAPNQLSQYQQDQVNNIFYPYKNIIYPHHVFEIISKRDVKGIIKSYSSNAIFISEFRKRKMRSSFVGEDFKAAEPYEAVWLDLTLKFRAWALENGYDSFIYSNTREGKGEDSCVTLLPKQLIKTGHILEFYEDKYLKEIPALIQNILDNKKYMIMNHIMWGKKNPMPYWI